MSKGLKALTALVRLCSILAAERAGTMTANDVIGVSAILPTWKEGQHTVESVVQHEGQPWRCLQTHDSTGNPLWCPGIAHSLWGAYHATTLERALPWISPTGAHDTYNGGEYMIWTDGATYLCKMDATVHDPEVLPSAWQKVADAPEPEVDEEELSEDIEENETDVPTTEDGDDTAISE